MAAPWQTYQYFVPDDSFSHDEKNHITIQAFL
jgi:hypothetical protein